MKKVVNVFAVAGVAALSFSSCKKAVSEDVNAIPQEVLSQVNALGFGNLGVQKADGGYIVEGDIFLSNAELAAAPNSPSMLIAQEEQYRTFNYVSATRHPIIYVALSSSSNAHNSAFSAALDVAIGRYNAESLTIKFQRATSNADITIVAYSEASNTLGSAGFPNSAGDPYSQIKMNTYHYATGTDNTNVNYIGTIMAHEMGHCIGFRHTDYMRRSASCGYGGNEGQANNGVGAVLIPGTPSGPDSRSWMLACIGNGVNRPFNANDKTALRYLW